MKTLFSGLMVGLLATGAVVLLNSCNATPYTREVTSGYALPEGLKDCRMYVMTADNGSYMRVVRCPLSQTTTTYTSGKSTTSVPVVEGQ